VNAEEYKQMQNLLQPIQHDRALGKIDQYQSNNNKQKKNQHGRDALEPLPGLDGISSLLAGNQKQVMNLSSAFSNFD
jgi:hypothetical protein